jgi:hypothetical protein
VILRSEGAVILIQLSVSTAAPTLFRCIPATRPLLYEGGGFGETDAAGGDINRTWMNPSEQPINRRQARYTLELSRIVADENQIEVSGLGGDKQIVRTYRCSGLLRMKANIGVWV